MLSYLQIQCLLEGAIYVMTKESEKPICHAGIASPDYRVAKASACICMYVGRLAKDCHANNRVQPTAPVRLIHATANMITYPGDIR